jgi:hypothetical protein
MDSTTGKRQLRVSADVTTCCSKSKTSCSHAVISRGHCPTISKRMVFLFIRGCSVTCLHFALWCCKTLRILPTHSYSTSYAACWNSAPAHVSPDVVSVCPHSPHRHVMRSLVATLASLPMPLAGTAGPVFHVTRSRSLCLRKPDPRIQASLSLAIRPWEAQAKVWSKPQAVTTCG